MDTKLVKIEFQGVKAGEFHLDSAAIEVPENQVEAAKGLIKQIYDAANEITRLNGEVERRDGQIDELQESQTNPANLDKYVAERADVLAVAEVSGLKRDDLRGMSVPEIKRTVVAKNTTSLKADASDDYVQGRYDMIQDQAIKTATSRRKLNALGGAVTGHQDTKALSEHTDSDSRSYREIAQERLAGLANKTEKQIADSGLN